MLHARACCRHLDRRRIAWIFNARPATTTCISASIDRLDDGVARRSDGDRRSRTRDDMGCELAAGRCRRKCRTGCGLCAHGPQCHGDYRSAKVEPYRMPCDSFTGCGAARIFSSANMLRSRSCERRAALSSARTHDPQSDFGGLADGKRADRHRRVPLDHYERHGQQLCQKRRAHARTMADR